MVLAKVINGQFHCRNHNCPLRGRSNAPPQSSHSLVLVDLLEGPEEVLIVNHLRRRLAQKSKSCAIRAVHLHSHLQHIRGIGDGRGNGACYTRTENINRNPLLARPLILQDAVVVGQLLERVVRAEFNGAIGRLTQYGWGDPEKGDTFIPMLRNPSDSTHPEYNDLMPSSRDILMKQSHMPRYLVAECRESACPWIWSLVFVVSMGNVPNSAVIEAKPPKTKGRQSRPPLPPDTTITEGAHVLSGRYLKLN